ncbi:MAG: hypothetical protein H6579_01155 [Chitinophagales bacterium]|nr:hypothetical protein [Chitinophagales bacterium]
MMKNNFVIFVLLVLLGLNACKEDTEGDLILDFNARINSTNLEFNRFYDMDGDSVRFEIFKFYISDFSVLNKDGDAAIPLGEVFLVDFENEASTSISNTMEVQSYKNPSFRLGLSNTQNETDPSTYAASHPLSLNQGNYWLMANSYIYFKIEGYTMLNGVESPFVYHVGFNDLNADIALERSFSIHSDARTTLIANIDINSLFANVDFLTESSTHTTNNMPLAVKMMNNFAQAITIN